jgi:hypothetical protein
MACIAIFNHAARVNNRLPDNEEKEGVGLSAVVDLELLDHKLSSRNLYPSLPSRAKLKFEVMEQVTRVHFRPR